MDICLEHCPHAKSSADIGGATLAQHMVTQSQLGDIYSREEYAGWLTGAGFRDISVIQLSDPVWQLVIANK